MSIKECFAPKVSKNTSSKNPKYYNEEKNRCIAKGACNEVTEVRMYFATSSHTPTKVIVAMLETEQDRSVLRAILMNNRLPRKAAAAFVTDETDERVNLFNDDQELITHFEQK